MAAIYPLATTTVGSGGTASFDFQNIPNTYTDLMILISARDYGSGQAFVYHQIKPNNTTTNYTAKYLGHAAGSIVSYTESVFGLNILGYLPGSTETSMFAITKIYIPNYTSSNNKSISVENTYSLNATSTNVYWGITAGLWSNTSVIDRIVIAGTNSSYSFAQYSTATLYGIK